MVDLISIWIVSMRFPYVSLLTNSPTFFKPVRKSKISLKEQKKKKIPWVDVMKKASLE